MNRVQGHCPACGRPELVALGGVLQCNSGTCPQPFTIAKILQDPEIHHIVRFDDKGFFNCQHPLRERADGQLLDCAIHEAVTEWSEPMSFEEHKALEGTSWRIRPAGEHNLDRNWV